MFIIELCWIYVHGGIVFIIMISSNFYFGWPKPGVCLTAKKENESVNSTISLDYYWCNISWIRTWHGCSFGNPPAKYALKCVCILRIKSRE